MALLTSPRKPQVSDGYAKLLSQVRETLLLGQQRVEEEKVRTYHETGRLINRYLHKSDHPNQEHGRQVVARLAEHLKIGAKVLYRCMRFAESFPTFAARRKLTWAHYRALMTLEDETKRRELTERAESHQWSSRALELKIRNLKWDARVQDLEGEELPRLAVPESGPLFHYRVLDPQTVQEKEKRLLLVDLGFSCCRDLDAITGQTFKPLDVIESVRVAEDRYRLQRSKKTESALYHYQATVEKVVDGDTLRVVVDLGFHTRTRQYLRLRGLDAPELDTREGRAAAGFVQARIRASDAILLTSTKSDKYDRYLADVFYQNKQGSLQYLNNELLMHRHAVRVRD